MACKDMNAVIDDRAVYVRQWDATTQLTNLNKGLRILGVNFASFVEGEYEFKDILRMLAQTEPEELMPLIKTYVCSARVEGTEITSATFNSFYNGELYLVFKIFAFVCGVQYKDFFEQGLGAKDQDQPQ